jgi:putative SOS response-associated peptidase YedK
MCGRYTLYKSEELVNRFNIDQKDFDELYDQLKKRYNVSPSQVMPAVVQKDDSHNGLDMMRWGYMPVWAKDPRDVFKYKTFNARSEEIFEKRTWKDAIRHRRCLIPANGFYEWKATDTGKQPYFIHPKDQDLFAFAGIWGTWADTDGRKWGTYSILTTSPNKEMRDIHTRMPVIVRPADEARWLDSDSTEPEDIADIMNPYQDDALEIYEVSRDVNTSRIDQDTLVLPLNSQ